MNLQPVLAELDDRERIYVECRLKGMTGMASLVASGLGTKHSVGNIEKRPAIALAISEGKRLAAEEVGFTRRKAHEMLMDAYNNSSTAAEQIQAVRELVKLHGVAAPTEVKHKHEHAHSLDITKLSDDELLRMAEGGKIIEGELAPPAELPAPQEAAA